MIDGLPEDQSARQVNQIKRLPKDYIAQFSKSEFDIGRTQMMTHTIKQALRRHPIQQLSLIYSGVQKSGTT